MVPAVTGDNNPVVEMVAVPVPLITVQVTFLLLALVGAIVAYICRVLPMATLVALPALVTVTAVTGTTAELIDRVLLATALVNAAAFACRVIVPAVVVPVV